MPRSIPTSAALLCLAALSAVQALGVQLGEPLDPYIDHVRTDPLVIREGRDTFRIEITALPEPLPGRETVSFELTFREPDHITRGGAPLGVVRFVDDGSGEDVQAGDGIFTAGGFEAVRSQPVVPIDAHNLYLKRAEVGLDDGTVFTFAPAEAVVTPLAIRVIDESRVPIPVPLRVDEGLQVTDHVAVLLFDKLTGPGWRRKMFGRPADHPERFYDYFPDDRDFLIYDRSLQIGLVNAPGSVAMASYGAVRSDVLGIGSEPFDLSHLSGSSRLRGIATFQASSYGTGYVTLLHELTHQWAVASGFETVDPDISTDGSHWARFTALGTTGFGQDLVRYTSFEEQAEDEFRAWKFDPAPPWAPFDLERFVETSRYNDLELYLMGLISADEVDPVQVLVNPELLSSSGEFDTYRADSVRTTSIDDIIGAFGPRIPSVSNARRSWNAAFVVPNDRPLTPVELAYFDFIARDFGRANAEYGISFEEATGGRATLDTRILPLQSVQTENPDTQAVDASDFFIYPNPGASDIRFSLTTSEAGRVAVQIFDMLGRRVSSTDHGHLPAGTHSRILTADGALKAGTYVCRAYVGMSSYDRVFVIR